MSKNAKSNKKIKQSAKSGLPPGTLIHTGLEKLQDAKITVIEYDTEKIKEYEADSFIECPDIHFSKRTVWINVNGVHEIELIQELENKYGLHPLVLEDIVNTAQRPKFEDYEKYYYIVLKNFQKKDNIVTHEQISLILLSNLVISFQENVENDIFLNIKNRLLNNKGKIRTLKEDFLIYSLIDTVVDNYFSILEEYGEKIEEIEQEIDKNPDKETLNLIHKLKREIVTFRKSVWPLREVIISFERTSESITTNNTKIYFRDVYDHVINLLDIIETYRDLLSSLFDVYLLSISNKTNEVIRLLTVIGTIFIPLTFITSLYGMNFKFMPELEWHYGYFVVVGIMFLISFGMVYFFRKNKWI